jgi:hypothetical protein
MAFMAGGVTEARTGLFDVILVSYYVNQIGLRLTGRCGAVGILLSHQLTISPSYLLTNSPQCARTELSASGTVKVLRIAAGSHVRSSNNSVIMPAHRGGEKFV